MTERARRAAESAAGEARRLPLPRRRRRASSTSARRSRCAARAHRTSRRATTHARRSAQLPERVADVEVIVTGTRGRGAPPRAEPRQAPPAAVQRPAARRQVVPVHRRHGRGRVPARDVHARAAPARRRLLRAVREREEGARDARRAQPRLPRTGRARGRSRAGTRASRASTTTSTAAWRPASGYISKEDYREIDRRRDRVPLRRHAADPARARAADAGGRRRRALRGRGALPQPPVRRSATSPSGRRPTDRSVGTVDVIGIAVEGDRAAVQVFPLRDGKLVDRYAFHLENVAGQDIADAARGVLPRVLRRRRRASRRRSSSRRTSGDTAALEEFLSERRGSRVEVRAPARGEKRRLQELADAERAARARVRGRRRPSAGGCAGSRRSRSCARR